MHPITLWQNYNDTLEKVLTPQSTHLELIMYSVAWLKSNYKSFQGIEQQSILYNSIFSCNFVEYATEHQELTAWEAFHRCENKNLTWIENLCFNALYPTLTIECEKCDYGNLKPLTDTQGNAGFYCSNCNVSFTQELNLAPDENGLPMTLKVLQDNCLEKFLLPNPLANKR